MRESIEYPGSAELRARLARAEAIAEELVKLNAERHALSCDPIIIHGCVEGGEMIFKDDRIGPGIPELAKRLRETANINNASLCPPHKTFLNSQNLTGCVLCDRNKAIEDLKAQLALSQKWERILRDGLREYAKRENWTGTTMNLALPYADFWMPLSNGFDIAETTLKAAEEVKCAMKTRKDCEA
jgi:hypothetical protein